MFMHRLACAEQRGMNIIFNIYIFSLSHVKCTVKTLRTISAERMQCIRIGNCVISEFAYN